MSRKSQVVDASVVLTFLFAKDKEKRMKIFKLLEKAESNKFHLYAPLLLKVEVANGLRFSETDTMKVHRLLDEFYQIPIRFIEPSSALLHSAIERSLEVGDTVYDALYHVLAQAHDAKFITCDKKYYERAKMYGDIELI